ncbi:MAG: hypothetical protein LBR71_00080 [Synergistaceae bacterium]|jgi:hypothetical protein|nr:hypothetical protein [Synergistaceae bacterium]
MKNEVLDALAHNVIAEVGRKQIEARRARQLLREENIDLDTLWKLLPKEPKPFDIAEVRDETHLREIIMDRVLETAAHNITASVMDGPAVPLAELPEEQQAKCLNKVMLDMLDSNIGPGPILRRAIAAAVLNYRMRDRLKDLLPTLPPPSPKSERVGRGIAYIEKQIKMGMFYFEAWTFFADGPGKKQSDLAKQNLVERFLKRETND